MKSYNNYKQSKELAKRIFLNELDEIKYFPKYINIETTNACNAKCKMCPHSVEVSKVTTMKDDLFMKIVEEIAPYRSWIESVALYWFGEPLLDKKLAKRILELKKIGIKNIHISTNAACLSKKVAKELFESGLNDLRISIDAIKKDTYEKIRVGLNFDTVIKNIKDTIDIRNKEYPNIPIRIRLTEMEQNKEELEEFVSYWKEYISDIDLIQIMPLHTKENWAIEEIKGKERDIQLESYPCIAPFSTMVIDSEGKVALCCQDTDKQQLLGDVKIQSMKEVWNEEKIEKIRISHLKEGRKSISTCSGCICWNRQFLNR